MEKKHLTLKEARELAEKILIESKDENLKKIIRDMNGFSLDDLHSFKKDE
jgi:hypothetical protein